MKSLPSMERDKTGDIVFLPLSSHPFFVPLSSCIYLVLPWDSATIDAYRIHRQGIYLTRCRISLVHYIFGSNNSISVLNVRRNQLTGCKARTLLYRVEIYCSCPVLKGAKLVSFAFSLAPLLLKDEMLSTCCDPAGKARTLPYLTLPCGNILFMSGYKGCWCTLLN